MTVVKTRGVLKNAKPSAPASPTKLDLAALIESFVAFRAAKDSESVAKTTHETLRDRVLMPAITTFGHTWGDQEQHQAIEFPAPVAGFIRLVRRANVSRSFNVEAARALVKRLKIEEEVSRTQVTLTWEGSPQAGEALAAKIRKAAGLSDDDETLTVHTDVSQDLLWAYHLKNKTRVTEKHLDGLIIEDTRYSFVPEKA